MDSLTLIIIVGAAAAGFVQGLSGFAFAMCAMAFWAWTVDPQLAAVVVVGCSVVGQAITIIAARRGFNLKRTLPFIIGGVLGVPLGIAILPLIDQIAFRAAVGGFLALYCPLMLFYGGKVHVQKERPAVNGGFGFIGGILGGIGGFAGAVPTLWASFQAWSKDEQRAIIQWFNLSMHIVTISGYFVRGIITAERASWLLIAIPAMVIPSLIGARMYTKISDAAFRRLILAILSLTGISLLISSVPRLITG
jgi:uncharacterized membrane protein YfcA